MSEAKKSPGRAKLPDHLKRKRILVTISQAAYAVYESIPNSFRSVTISNFLESFKGKAEAKARNLHITKKGKNI